MPEGEGPGESIPRALGLSEPILQDEVHANLLLQQIEPLKRDQVRSLIGGMAFPASRGWDQCLTLGCGSGPEAGLTPGTRERPALTRLLCRFIREQCPSGRFSAITVRRTRVLTCCKDESGLPGAPQIIIPVGRFKGGGMWIKGSSDLGGTSFRWEPSFRELRSGSTHSVFPYLCFDASRCHEVQEFQGDRLILLGSVPVCTPGLSEGDLQWLENHGFSLPDLERPSVSPRLQVLTSVDGLPPLQDNVRLVHCLRRIRELDTGLLSGLDIAQANLKAFVWELKHSWDVLNSCDEGFALARVIQKAERAVELLEEVLQTSRTPATVVVPDPVEASLRSLGPITPEPALESVGNVDHDPALSGAEGQPCPVEIPLQTRSVELAEVLDNVEKWKPSWIEEYNSLVKQHEAVEAIDPAILDEWSSTGRRFQVLPSNLVHTVKARTGRLKARAVCCGNFETGVIFSKHETYAGGVCATSLRAVLRCCAAWGWGFSFVQSDLIDAHDIRNHCQDANAVA